MSRIDFFREGMKDLGTIGSIARSSKYLCRYMVRLADLNTAKCVVELGAGDGVMTHHILAAMPPDAKLLSFEINEKFCDILRKIEDPRLHVIEDSAEHMMDHAQKLGFEEVDTVFSALPFVVLPAELSKSIVRSCHDALKPMGQFIQFHYSLMMIKLYKEVFKRVSIKFELFNLPPAFIILCSKGPVDNKFPI